MANFQIRIVSDEVEHPFVSSTAPSLSFSGLKNIIQRFIGGANRETATIYAKHTLVAASGTITLEEGTGTITATINGVAIQITWATDDATSAGLLANAINASANALVANHVTAVAVAEVVTITAVSPGIVGNTITLAASGTGATASGARLTGGSETRVTYTF
jgi:phage tail sheath gpL-like